MAGKIRTHLAAPYAVDGSTIMVTTSIGTAVYPVDGQDFSDLMQQSDSGRYRAKARCSAPPGLEPATQN